MTQNLDDLLDFAWTELVRAVRDTRHGFHWPVASTIADAEPEARVVVLRSIEPRGARCTFHTDRRAPKVEQIERRPVVALTFHDSRLKLQVRARCDAFVALDGDVVDTGWERLGASSKRCYLAPHPPSSPAAELSHNLPEHVLGRVLGDDDVAAGRGQFAVVGCTIRELDLLVVAPEGHRRARYAFDDGGVASSTWLHP